MSEFVDTEYIGIPRDKSVKGFFFSQEGSVSLWPPNSPSTKQINSHGEKNNKDFQEHWLNPWMFFF